MESNLDKFPLFLQNAFRDKGLSFPPNTRWHYAKVYAYRAIEWHEGRNLTVSIDDFRSYAELGRRPRGIAYDIEKKPEYYGVSLSTDSSKLCNLFKFPNPRKKLAKGYIVSEGGPIYNKRGDSHITWWLFENSDALLKENFEIEKAENDVHER